MAKENNIMRKIRVEKITFNVGAGKDQVKLEKATKLIKHLTGLEPVKTRTNKRIPGWGLRPGLPIGVKLTIRDSRKTELIKTMLKAKSNTLSLKNFDDNGNISFGIHEYIDIPSIEYNPEIGIMGFQLSITLSRPGFRIAKRKINTTKIPHSHRISKQEAVQFMKDNFGVKIKEEIKEE